MISSFIPDHTPFQLLTYSYGLILWQEQLFFPGYKGSSLWWGNCSINWRNQDETWEKHCANRL